MAKATVYNLSWFSKVPGEEESPALVGRSVYSTLGQQKQIGVVILYPSLTTPEIVASDDDKLELLILTQADADLPARIRSQLKIVSGFDPKKTAVDRDLFVGADGNLVGVAEDWAIETQVIPFGVGTELSTKSGRFKGYVDKRAHKLYVDAGYTKLYRVSLSNKCLTAAMGGGSISCWPEPQDKLITKVLDKYHPTLKQGNHYYCLGETGGDVDFLKSDKENPIQSWHPVYRYAGDLEYANFAHIADIHIAARQQVLAKTTARVIDYVEAGAEAALDKSPHIGPLVNICSKIMMDIFNKFGESDMLLIGGDLVDCLRSCFLTPGMKVGTPKQIWDAVGLGSKYRDTYKDCVDLVSFYGVLVEFCRSQSKPAYLISGNHDCYFEPYGLSPRVITAKVKRANEGIPADHNLTFYEACLSFGETYHVLKSGLGSPFEKSMFEWFYAVFTPFEDFSVELPKQLLVAAGWGDDEILISPSEAGGIGQGLGHLPRASEVVSKSQMALIDAAVQKQKNVILMTHYTFVSYLESLRTDRGDTDLGDVYFGPLRNFNKYNMGTFESNRVRMFEEHIGKRAIQVILTGHSHRRALYLADHIDFSGRNSLVTRHFDFVDFPKVEAKYASKLRPAIVVSDSGGTIPRYNLGGEFFAWGCDIPSGTVVKFDQGTGNLHDIATARTEYCKPRVAVALDYMDIFESENVIESFRSRRFKIADEKRLKSLQFDIKLHKELRSRGIYVREMTLFLQRSVGWRKVHMTALDPANVPFGGTPFVIGTEVEVAIFTQEIAKHRDRGAFIAIQFGADKPFAETAPWAFERYDFDDSWCFEFQVDEDKSGGGIVFGAHTDKWYIIERNKDRAEFPDFDWRRKSVAAKYAV